MRRRWWTLAVVLLVIAAAVGGTLYLRRPRPDASKNTDERVELVAVEEGSLVKIALSDRAEGTLALRKDGEQWVAESAPWAPLASANASDLAYHFWSLTAERVVEENPSDLAQYGLSPARARASAAYADGTARTLLLGDRTPGGDAYYLQVEGSPKVYTVWSTVGEHLHWVLEDLRDRTVRPVIIPENVTFMRLRRPDGTVVEIEQKSADDVKTFQVGFGRYFLTRPYSRPRGMDPEKQEAFLLGPLGITIDDFVDDRPADPAAYGLAKPWAEMVVRDTDNTLRLQVGSRAEGARRYFRIDGSPSVYAVDESKLAFIDTPTFDLVDKFVFIPNIDDVDRIDITADGAAHVLRIDRAAAPAQADGEAGAVEATYTVDGRRVEEESFRAFYQALIGLLVEGEIRSAPAGAPAVRMRYLLNKGADRDVGVSFVPYDRDFYAAFVDGRCDFAVSRAQVDRMQDSLRRFLAGEKPAA